jgi:hypothetical protein
MAIAFLVAYGLEHGFLRWEKTLLAIVWFSPFVARSPTNDIPVGFLALSAVFALILVRAMTEQRGAAHEGSSDTPPKRALSV